MADRVLNLDKLIGTLDMMASDFDAARKEIEMLDDEELERRAQSLDAMADDRDYKIVWDRNSIIDQILDLHPPANGEDRARLSLSRLDDQELNILHTRLTDASINAAQLMQDRIGRLAAKRMGQDGSEDGVPYAHPPEELHY